MRRWPAVFGVGGQPTEDEDEDREEETSPALITWHAHTGWIGEIQVAAHSLFARARPHVRARARTCRTRAHTGFPISHVHPARVGIRDSYLSPQTLSLSLSLSISLSLPPSLPPSLPL